MSSIGKSRLLGRILEAVAFLALFVGLEWLSFLHEKDGYPVTPWNPGLGVAFAMIVYRGASFAPLFLAGVLLAEVLVVRSTLPWAVLLTLSVGVVISYVATALAARRWLRSDAPIEGSGDVIVIVTAGATGAALDAAILTGLLSTVSGLENLQDDMLSLMVGDLIGIAVFAPLVLRLFQYRLHLPARPHARSIVEAMVYVAFIAVALLVALRPAEGWPRDMFYLLFLPVVVASIRFGVDAACASLAAAQLGLVTILHLQGFDLARFTDYQVMMLVLTLTGLIVGGLSSERQAAEAGARRAARRVAELQAEAARAARFNVMSGISTALAHEINQPMTAARALARAILELLRIPQPDLTRAAANAARLIEHVDTAGAIISRMRAFLRRGEPHVSTVDVRELIEEAVALVRPLAASRQIMIEAELPDNAPALHGDRVQLQQVIINLVLNAIEAVADSHRADGRIDVRAERAANAMAFSVTDNGAGVPMERADAIFEPLNTSRPGGMGLGLAISRSIVEAHGGRIWLRRSEPGRTEFCFTIPIEGSGRA